MTKRELAQKKKSLRLEGYDYSNEGAYFVTLITKDYKCVFGIVLCGEVVLSELGQIAQEEWFNSSNVRATGQLPTRQEQKHKRGPKPRSLSSFIVGYKGKVTKRANTITQTPGNQVWMRNYHDRISRNKMELSVIREYIQNNPKKWELDKNFREQ